jgi:hypothetical protein
MRNTIKTSVKKTGVSAVVQTEHLSDTNLKPYHYTSLVVSEGNRQVGRRRRRWEDNI